MSERMRRAAHRLVSAAACMAVGVVASLLPGGAFAQAYPAKPLRFVVAFPAGSATRRRAG
jgi:tripartite-type tricarboxylate transporter receptor subunit TctC